MPVKTMPAFSEIYEHLNRKFGAGFGSEFRAADHVFDDNGDYVRRGEFEINEGGVSIDAAKQMMDDFRSKSAGQSPGNQPIFQEMHEHGGKTLKVIISSIGFLLSVCGCSSYSQRKAYLQHHPVYGLVVLGALIVHNSERYTVLVGRTWNGRQTRLIDTQSDAADEFSAIYVQRFGYPVPSSFDEEAISTSSFAASLFNFWPYETYHVVVHSSENKHAFATSAYNG